MFGLLANPEIDWSIQMSSKPEVVVQLVFPVLLYYPELPGLSPTRSAQYETAMKTEKTALYLYGFTESRRRGLAQAPIERRGGA